MYIIYYKICKKDMLFRFKECINEQEKNLIVSELEFEGYYDVHSVNFDQIEKG